MDHPTQRLLERTNLPESYSDRLRGAIKGLPLPRGVVHARMPDGSFAVFKDAGGKKRLATFLSKHMSPPGRDVTSLVKEKLMKKSANHMVEPSPDGGNYMAVSNLKSLKRNAEDMMCYVDPATPLPDWVESKLNVAAASIDDVADWFRNGGELNKLSSYSLYDYVMKLAEDPRLEQAGVEGYNKPKRTPDHPTKSHIVVAKDGDEIKTIRFGQQGVKTNQTAGQREAFKSRHAKNIAKGKMSAAYWADKVKWSPSKTKDKDNDNWVKGSSDLSYLKKLADFANETLAQKAHDQVVKEYGLTPQDGSQYWRLKTRIYKSMGGTFTGRREKKSSETYRPRVELFIHDGKGNVLANKSDKGWQFPGGGIEEGQDIFEAARREALEEAGYKIKRPKTLGNEASMVPWPEWYKEVARSKGRGQYEGQKTHAIVAQVGKKDNKLYGSEGDALTKLKFVPLKKLIRDGEKRISPDHDDIVTNTGEVIPGFAVFSRDTLKHLKNLEQELAGKKTAADFSLMSVAKDLRKTAGVYDTFVKRSSVKLPLAKVRDTLLGSALGGAAGYLTSDEDTALRNIGIGTLAGAVPGLLAKRLRAPIVAPLKYKNSLEAVTELPLRGALSELPFVGKRFDAKDIDKLTEYMDEVKHLDPIRARAAIMAPGLASAAAGLAVPLAANNILED